MLRFSGQPSAQKPHSTGHSEPVSSEEMPQSKQDVPQSRPNAVGGQPANAQQPQQQATAALQLPNAAAFAGVGAAAGAAIGTAAASATKPKTAEQTDHISRVSISLRPAFPAYSTMRLNVFVAASVGAGAAAGMAAASCILQKDQNAEKSRADRSRLQGTHSDPF